MTHQSNQSICPFSQLFSSVDFSTNFGIFCFCCLKVDPRQ
jgi:hypothetical protein